MELILCPLYLALSLFSVTHGNLWNNSFGAKKIGLDCGLMPKAANWLVILDGENTATMSDCAVTLHCHVDHSGFLVTFQGLRVPIEGAKSHQISKRRVNKQSFGVNLPVEPFPSYETEVPFVMASSSPSKAFPTEASRAELH